MQFILLLIFRISAKLSYEQKETINASDPFYFGIFMICGDKGLKNLFNSPFNRFCVSST